MHPMDSFQFPAVGNVSPATHPQQVSTSLPHPFKQEEDSSFSTAIFDDGDHRRRRRNRTTQSCWSCHQAKRRCDRKRPCSRCIQLGLTGLCVYETDDPASRDDPSLSEVQRLKNRIAELEKLVRELKNKPHPKWVVGGMFKGPGPQGLGTPGTPALGGTPLSAPVGGGAAMKDMWNRFGEGTPGDDVSSAASTSYRFPSSSNHSNTLGVPLTLSLDGSSAGGTTNANTNGGGAYTDPSYYLDGRRPSLVSVTSTNTGTSSPRTPYLSGYYSTTGHQNQGGAYTPSSYGSGGMAANPCGCLASSANSDPSVESGSNMDIDESDNSTAGRGQKIGSNVASRLARAIRGVILESGVVHPYAEGCKVLALVRELEGLADSSASASTSYATNSSSTTTTTNGTVNGNGYPFYANGTTNGQFHPGGHSPPPPPPSTTNGTISSDPSAPTLHSSSYAHHAHAHAHPHTQTHHHHAGGLTHSHSHLGISSISSAAQAAASVSASASPSSASAYSVSVPSHSSHSHSGHGHSHSHSHSASHSHSHYAHSPHSSHPTHSTERHHLHSHSTHTHLPPPSSSPYPSYTNYYSNQPSAQSGQGGQGQGQGGPGGSPSLSPPSTSTSGLVGLAGVTD